jgi:trehalose-6-phosphatase
MMSSVGTKTPIDFLMYIGDETENEEAFEYLNHLNTEQGKRSKFVSQEASIYTVAMGMKATQANYFLSTPDSATALFEHLSQSIKRKKDSTRRIQSQIDFMPLFGGQVNQQKNVKPN